MALSVGDKLGPYEIVAPIGKGGMGEVYKALDTKLDREVAIKILPSALAQDPERLARFEREAKVLASLNHPNIAQVYAIEESSTGRALVMELVPGETLGGPLPLETALNYAKQMAEALEAAHDKSIIHRDLKPANIMVTPAGTVKVLDFGLAAVTQPSAASNGDPSNSPTLTMRATQAGMILGTAGYMAPEQAAGQPVDKRADIWSFGVVLYEMLTGQRLFTGDSIAHILADVLRAPIDFDKLPKETPRAIRDLLKRCLDRNVKTRLRDIGEARIAIQNVGKEPEVAATTASTSRLSWLAWSLAVIGCAALSLTAWMFLRPAFVHFREAPPEQRSVRFQIPAPEKSNIQMFRLSPDGRSLAFIAGDRRLWVRALDSLQAQGLAATEGATIPFWSPDSQFIGFFAQGKLKKVATAGGPPQIVCDATYGVGGTWNRDGVILFAPALTSGLFRVPAAGGVPIQVTTKSISTGSHRYPEFLPDGRHFVYTVFFGGTEETGIYVGSLDGKPPVRLLPEASNAVYAPPGTAGRSGHLLFRRGDVLMAQPFDLARLRMSGDVFPVVERVGVGGIFGLGAFSLSEDGTLAYAAGGTPTIQLVWTDRAGKPTGLFGPLGAYNRFRLAPDEKRIVFDVSNQDIGVLDSVRGVNSRLTFDPALDNVPMWSPDGLRVLWASNRSGGFDLYVKAANGTGPEELLIKMGTGNGWGTDWSRDGRFILYQTPGAKTGQDLWIAPQFGDRKPFLYLQTQFDEQEGRFSPDGNWVAYVSNESSQDEVYVQPFPPSGAKFQISSGGGSEPQWRSDGTELFYMAADQMLMAVPVKLGRSASESFQVGVPKPLMSVPPAGITGLAVRSYAVSKDGQRFLIPSIAGGETGQPITVLLNWPALLKKN